MSSGGWMMVVTALLTFGALAFLLFSLFRSIQDERTAGRSIWREFGLGLSLMFLFFGTWFAHGIAQWQSYTDEHLEHGQPVELGLDAAQGGFHRANAEEGELEAARDAAAADLTFGHRARTAVLADVGLIAG